MIIDILRPVHDNMRHDTSNVGHLKNNILHAATVRTNMRCKNDLTKNMKFGNVIVLFLHILYRVTHLCLPYFDVKYIFFYV